MVLALGAHPALDRLAFFRFVVRQSYLTLSIQSFTATQTGESKVEALMHNVRTDATRLAYVFELKSKAITGPVPPATATSACVALRRVASRRVRADCDDVRQVDDVTALATGPPMAGRARHSVI